MERGQSPAGIEDEGVAPGQSAVDEGTSEPAGAAENTDPADFEGEDQSAATGERADHVERESLPSGGPAAADVERQTPPGDVERE